MEPPPPAENLFAPPGGSVFDSVTGGDGPPMMRMILTQGVFEMASKNGKLRPAAKVIILCLVSFYFIFGDFKRFRTERGENIYSQVGLTRQVTPDIILEEYNQYIACENFDPECRDKKKSGKIHKLDKELVEDIFYALKNPTLREQYDKSETFIRKKTLKKAPTEGQRYMTAFGEINNYVVFIFLTTMLVQDHQHFAKQITIGLLIAFSYATVSLKLPKEVNEAENLIIQFFDWVPFCGNYCYFEIAYLLKIVLYPSLFNMTLNVSRIIDIEPSLEFKMRILGAQKQLTRVFLPLEMLI